MARFLEQLRRAYSIESGSTAGNSMGGGVAWTYALMCPDRVDILILVSAAADVLEFLRRARILAQENGPGSRTPASPYE